MRVLIVDDEMAIREWIKFSIEKMKLPDIQEVYTAANSHEALEIYGEAHPELVFMDMMLPNVHGLELIQILRSYTDDVQIYIISSHAVFEYVRTGLSRGAVEYILKEELSFEKLSCVVKEALERKDHLFETSISWRYNDTAFLQSVCMGEQAAVDEESLARYDVPLKDSRIFILIGDIGLLSALELLKLPARVKLNRGSYFTMRHNYHVLLTNAEGIADDEGAGEVVEYLKNNLNLVLNKGSVEVGVAGGWSELAAVFQSTLYRLQMHFYDEEGFTEEGSGENVDKIVEAYRDKMLHRQKLKTLSGYRAEIENLIMEIYEKKPVPIDRVKYGVFEILSMVIQNVEPKLEQGFMLRTRERLTEAESFELLRQAVSEICDKIDSCAEFGTQMSSTVRQAMGYIRENLLQAVCLEDVALHVGQSPDYLSRLMKKELGEGFMDYITRLKMEKAVELLQTTYMKVYEVAEALGYSNVSYFSELFRKRVGVNPCKYKRYYSR